MPRARVLALHGYHGSAEILRRQTAELARAIADHAELVFVDAPSLAAGDHGWWHLRAGAAVGWERTRDALAAYCAAHGPFDGVLGFSQGAALAALLLARAAIDRTTPVRFDVGILVGGFASRAVVHARMFEAAGAIDVPTVHVIGRADGIVPPAESRELAARFVAPQIVEHPGGHVVASTLPVCAAARALLGYAARVAASS